MTEEVLDQEGQVEQTEQNAPEFTEIEQRALEQGWRPRTEWDGAEDDFIEAKEFVRRKPLFDKIEHQSKEIKNVQKTLNQFKQHYANVEKAAYDRAIKELKGKQKAALENGDIDTFQSLQDEIEDTRDQARELATAQEQPQTQEVHPEFQSWVNRNPWYASEDHMKVYADKVGTRLHATGMHPADVLREVEKAVRKEFPTKFRNPNQERPGAVESGSTPSRSATKSENFQLTEQERKIMNDLVRTKVLTKEKYIADLKLAKGMK